MQESHTKGVATHRDPESCAVAGNGGGEALTGACAGRPLSRENVVSLRGADAVAVGGRPHRTHRDREMCTDPARSETPSMHRTISHGNREVPMSAVAQVTTVRTAKPEGVRR